MSYLCRDSVRSHPRSFAAGLVLDETDKRKDAKAGHSIADLLVPIFFVTVGVKNLGVLNPAIPSNREGLIMATFLILVAILGCHRLCRVWSTQINRLAIV